jgi:hypothetical protein
MHLFKVKHEKICTWKPCLQPHKTRCSYNVHFDVFNQRTDDNKNTCAQGLMKVSYQLSFFYLSGDPLTREGQWLNFNLFFSPDNFSLPDQDSHGPLLSFPWSPLWPVFQSSSHFCVPYFVPTMVRKNFQKQTWIFFVVQNKQTSKSQFVNHRYGFRI